MTSFDLPVHRPPIESVTVQTDRRGRKTPPQFKVMSSFRPGRRPGSAEIVPATHAMPELGDIDLAANIRILVRAGGVGTAGSTLESSADASSVDSPQTIHQRSSYRHPTPPQLQPILLASGPAKPLPDRLIPSRPRFSAGVIDQGNGHAGHAELRHRPCDRCAERPRRPNHRPRSAATAVTAPSS